MQRKVYVNQKVNQRRPKRSVEHLTLIRQVPSFEGPFCNDLKTKSESLAC